MTLMQVQYTLLVISMVWNLLTSSIRCTELLVVARADFIQTWQPFRCVQGVGKNKQISTNTRVS